jgi:hypothetical protein
MIPTGNILLPNGEIDVLGFAGHVGAFLTGDLIDCVGGESSALRSSIDSLLEQGLLRTELGGELLVATDEGLRRSGLSQLGPCEVRRTNVLDLIEHARLTMELEALGYPVVGSREQRCRRLDGHSLPYAVVRNSGGSDVNYDPDHLLWTTGSSDERPIALQVELLRNLRFSRLREVLRGLHRCEEMMGVISYAPADVVPVLEDAVESLRLDDQVAKRHDFDSAVEAVRSGKRIVILPESPKSAQHRDETCRIIGDFGKHDGATISYHAAVEAINHALPEVSLIVSHRKARELIKRVLHPTLEGQPIPSGDSNVAISYRKTVAALAVELRQQCADLCGRSPEHVAEWVLGLPLQLSIASSQVKEDDSSER